MIRKHLLTMVVRIAVLDTAAIGVYYLAHLETASPTVRNTFTVVWTLATLVVVGIGLRRIRLARRGEPPTAGPRP